MPHNPLTRARKNTVKTSLTPQTPGDWLLSQYERQERQRRHGLLCDGDGDPTVHSQPMFTLKPLMLDDADALMGTGSGGFDDRSPWWS